METKETKPDAPQLCRPPGSGTGAWTQRRDRRGLPPRPPARLPPPPPSHAASGRRGEGRRAAAAPREEVEGATGDTGRAVATREARRNVVDVVEHGARAQEADGSAEASEERPSDGVGRKRRLSPPAQPPTKRKAVQRKGNEDPPEWWKGFAIPLGRNRDADSSRHHPARAHGGSCATEKATPRLPRASTKDGVVLGEARPLGADTRVLNKVPSAGDAHPRARGGHHGADKRMVKSSETLTRTTVPAADDFSDTGSHGADGYTLKHRGTSAGTSGLQKKEKGLPPKVSAELLRGRSYAVSKLGRGRRETRLPSEAVSANGGSGASKGVVTTDAGSSVAKRHPCYGAVQDEELEEGKNARKMCPVKASRRNSSNGKTSKNRSQSEERSPSWNFAKNVKGLNKSGGTSCSVVTKSSAQGPSKEHMKGKKASEIRKTNRVSSDVPLRMSSQSNMVGDKIVRSPGKVVNPAKLSEKFKVKEKETEHGRLVTTNGSKNKGVDKDSNDPLIKFVDALDVKEKIDSKVTFNLKDDDVLMAGAISEGQLKLYTCSSSDRPLRCQRKHGIHNADARSKFKMICRRFELLCRVLVRAVEQHSMSLSGAGGRIHNVAHRAMKKMPDFSRPDPVVGDVPGVEVGDQFLYRVQLAIVGLHGKPRGGIDWTRDKDGKHIAVAIVCSGGYPDELLCSGELIYTGSGKKNDGNQKRERGNLALENCIKRGSPVRVIYGFKSRNVEEHSHSRTKKFSMYIYDGLYKVLKCCEEGEQGSRMLKYTLKKMPKQPKLLLYIAEQWMNSKVRPGLRMTDISNGKEDTCIYVINTEDDALPARFKYIPRIKSYPTEVHSQGCECTNGCSDSHSCSCARKNGGKLPFNLNGAIVSESSLIFECGPSCKCLSSCHNKVGQHGIKIPLEVFRTSKKGWGVRSLRSISSGSFVCEYVGQLRHSAEADQRNNSNYLFNLAHGKGSQQQFSGLNSSGTCSGIVDDVGFTIDATKSGNVGRFISHSSSPNLFAQNVLWDHGDKRLPHIMFFAMETIPPLQELTCEYK